jgi:O-antigen/teichoic acid export membrane protein
MTAPASPRRHDARSGQPRPREVVNGTPAQASADGHRASHEENILLAAQGGGISFAGKLVLAASRLVLAVLLARILGAEQFGFYNIALSTGAIAASLSIFGLDSAILRYVALAASRRDQRALSGALQFSLFTAGLLGATSATVLFALAYPIAERVFGDIRLAPLLQLTSVFVPVLALVELLHGASRAFKTVKYSVLAESVVQPAVRLVLTIAVALLGLTAFHAVAIYGIGVFATSAALIYLLNRQFRLKRPWSAGRKSAREILLYSIPVWLSDLMIGFRSNLQTLLVGSLYSIAGVGVFAVANQISLLGNMICASITTSAKPMIVEMHDRGDHSNLGLLYQATTKWSLTTMMPVFLTMVLLPGPILAIFGDEYTGGTTALVLLAVSSLSLWGLGMGGTILDMAGYANLKLANAAVRLVLTVGLNVLLIPPLGIVGAALALLVGEVTINVLRVVEVYWLFRIVPYNSDFLKPLTAAAAAIAVDLLLQAILPAGTHLGTAAIYAAAIFGVYLVITAALGLSPDERLVLRHLRQRVSALFALRVRGNA